MNNLLIGTLILAAAALGGCGDNQPGAARRTGTAVFADQDCCSSHLECQDGLWCTGTEGCNCWGVCIQGDPPDCNDGNSLTLDTCVNDTIGREGVRGTGSTPGVNGEIGTGHCEHFVGSPCETDADCDDQSDCTTEVCVGNSCVYTTLDCDDGDVCTADSCDPAMGCVHNVLQLCCTTDADCDDGNECSTDTCDTTAHLCIYGASMAPVCTYDNECFDPGTCEADGLCHPGAQRTPGNDTCAGAMPIVMSDIGEACVMGTTRCARHDYIGSCAAGQNPDVVYQFDYPSWAGAEVSQNGTSYTARQRADCPIVDGTAVGCCVTNWWEFSFNFPATGAYRTGIETSNDGQDLRSQGIKHRVSVYLDGVFKGEIVNAASDPDHQTGTLFLGNVTAGAHTLRYYWTNDWSSPPFESNIMLHRVWIQSDAAPYQLYSYNCVLDGEYDTVMYARLDCGSAASELECNNNCVGTSLLNCGFYNLDTTDSAFTLPPRPVGYSQDIWFIIDGRGGESGDFELQIHRILHKNNPCALIQDNSHRVDATGGGEFRGNINGYINDMLDASYNWLKTPCHSGAAAGSDWPAQAWFVLRPQTDTIYRVWTDEATPSTWFDSVVAVWENNSAAGCAGMKAYEGCAHLTGRNGPDAPTTFQFTALGGRVYLVGISSFNRPTAGNYILHFDIM